MTLAAPPETILNIKNLEISFRSAAGSVRAVNGVNLQVRRGEIMGLVGESGSGKSVTARSVVGLVPTPPAVYEQGEIWLQSRAGLVDVIPMLKKPKQLRAIRGRDVSMIFQEPMRSLHPMMTVGSQLIEGIVQNQHLDARAAYEKAAHMLDLVGLPQPRRQLERYPHELSGGMRQRVMIALALSSDPQLLIADEPTTALDVTIQAQILDLLRGLRDQLGMSILLITHDMGVVASMAERVSVMYLGVIVESGPVEKIFNLPSHPYTQGLLESTTSLFSVPKTRLPSLKGVVPELSAAPTGCVFADRCPHVMPKCAQRPPVVPLDAEHSVNCWLYDKSDQDNER